MFVKVFFFFSSKSRMRYFFKNRYVPHATYGRPYAVGEMFKRALDNRTIRFCTPKRNEKLLQSKNDSRRSTGKRGNQQTYNRSIVQYRSSSVVGFLNIWKNNKNQTVTNLENAFKCLCTLQRKKKSVQLAFSVYEVRLGYRSE